MDQLNQKVTEVKAHYNASDYSLDSLADLVAYCLKKLKKSAKSRRLAVYKDKHYSMYYQGGMYSRPFLARLFIPSQTQYLKKWNQFKTSFSPSKHRITMIGKDVARVLYTAISAISICYDLWQPGSRKTPGTIYEVLIGSILSSLLPDWQRTKHVIIPNQSENVSTDIVFKKDNRNQGLVIPVKITTRERIVQPFAHQRILDSVFGKNKFKSILICVSEMQRSGGDAVNEICVPGTIKLFQSHLAELQGIYYLDPPVRYLQSDLKQHLPIASLDKLLTKDLPSLLR